MIEDRALNISFYEYKIYIKEIEDPEKGDIISEKNPFENSSFKKEKEKSQRGESMLNQSIYTFEMSEESQNGQNSNIQSYSKNLNENQLDRKSFIEAKKEQENKNASAYPKGYELKLDNINDEVKIIFNKQINDVCNILKESTIILRVNYHKKINIKFEKIIYKKREKRRKTEIAEKREITDKREKRPKTEIAENRKIDIREITYKQFTTLSKEEQEQKYELDDYNNLFENYKQLIRFLKEIPKELFSKINLQIELLIKINLKEDKNKNDKNKKYINSKYIIENSFSQKKIKYYCYQDSDILNHCNYKGFTSFLEKMIELEKQSSNNNIFKPEICSKEKQNLEQENIDNNSTKSASNSKISIKKIKKPKEIIKKVIELDDGSILSNERIINFKINENPNNDDKNKEFIIEENHIDYKYFSKNNYYSIDNSKNETLYPCTNIFKLKDGDYIIFNNTGIYTGSNFFKDLFKIKYSSLSKNDYIGGIKINDEIIAFMPNKEEIEGKNKIINSLDFYNVKLKKHLNDIILENYSFLLSGNNFPIMKIKIKELSLLLIACKNNNDGVKNGILLIKLQFNEDNIKKTYLKFYDTNNFEVYCFCPLFKLENIFKNIQVNETEYFLVGGFDSIKKQGLIKLYEIENIDKNEKIEITFIQDIIIEKNEGSNGLEYFGGFKEPISCIIQSLQGEIFVICKDGNEYSFSEPNFERKRENKDKSNLESRKKNL
jgi:hypothetical protein